MTLFRRYNEYAEILSRKDSYMICRNSKINGLKLIRGCLASLFLLFIFSGALLYVNAADTGLPEGYVADAELNRDLNLNKYGVPVHQYKNVFEEELITVPDINVLIEDEYSYDDDNLYPADDGILFRVYNATIQKVEKIAETKDGKISGLKLRRGHAYMITAADNQHIISNYTQYGVVRRLYVWALKSGDQGVSADGAYDYKTGYNVNDAGEIEGEYLSPLTEITLHYSSQGFADPLRYTMRMPVRYGGTAADGVRFTFTSTEDEPITAVSADGIVQAELLEDVDYTVHVDDANYDIETFTVAVKDKSEHKFIDEVTGNTRTYDRYCYDHTCCQGADAFNLISKSAAAKTRQGSVSSLRTYKDAAGVEKPVATVSGMNFKNLLLLVRNNDFAVPAEFEGTDYETVDYTLVNPHRWEICRVTEVDMHVKQHLSQTGKKVSNVYLIQDGSLTALAYKQPTASEVEFDVRNMPFGPIIIEYGEAWPEDPAPAPKAAVKTAPAEITDLPAVKITKAKASGKSATVKWKKVSKKNQKKIAKIQIQYSTDKNFASADTKIKFAKKNKTSLKIKKLRSKKTYYVRIRSYKVINGTAHVSKWSKIRKVKVR